ncbi:MAG TPA: helix-turn-helix transcriptional regulator [Verrucomicrobiae bacterium]
MNVLNAEFARLLASSGWKQSEAARQLELSPAVVTRYLSDDTRPSLTVLKLFKLLIGDMLPLPGESDLTGLEGELERPLDSAERQLLTHLRAMPDAQRRKVIHCMCSMLGATSAVNTPSKTVPALPKKARAKKRQNGANGAKN